VRRNDGVERIAVGGRHLSQEGDRKGRRGWLAGLKHGRGRIRSGVLRDDALKSVVGLLVKEHLALVLIRELKPAHYYDHENTRQNSG
jgi:hypothetical protein